MKKWQFLAVLVLAWATTACLDNTGDDCEGEDCSEPYTEVDRLRLALQSGDSSEVFTAINDGEEKGTLSACDAAWGRSIGGVLSNLESLNELLDNPIVRPFLPESEGDVVDYQALAKIDGNNLISGFLDDFETDWNRIIENSRYVIDNNCEFDVQGGVPFVAGVEGTLVYAKVSLGDIWNTDEARLLLSSFSTIVGVVDFVLAHNLQFDSDDIQTALDVISKTNEDNQDEERETAGSAAPIRHSYIPVLRSAGAIFDLLPDFLGFSNQESDFQRFGHVDDALYDTFSAIYKSDSSGESGVIPDLLNQKLSPSDASDHVLALVDEDLSNSVTAKDRLVIGIRHVNLGSTLVLPQSPEGIQIFLPKAIGDIEETVAGVHDIIDTLGEQFERVNDNSVPEHRLTVAQINRVIAAVDVLAENVDPLPPVVEVDFGAFFIGTSDNPVRPVRGIVPFWYDHDSTLATSFSTPDQFMIEGESNVGYDDDYVYAFDASHFVLPEDNDTFGFGAVDDIPENISSQEIDIDGLFPTIVDFPLPYIAWQDPSFHNVIWTDARQLPEIGAAQFSADGMRPATQEEINAVTIWFALKALDQVQEAVPAP